MILRYVLHFATIAKVLARVKFLSLYVEFLRISSKGFFFAWVMIAMISIFVSGLEAALRYIELQVHVIGLHGLGVFLVAVVNFPIGLLIGLIVIDCLVAGLRARNQFLLGSIFSSESYDTKQAKLLQKINEVIYGR